jgi:hypothetical protein
MSFAGNVNEHGPLNLVFLRDLHAGAGHFGSK